MDALIPALRTSFPAAALLRIGRATRARQACAAAATAAGHCLPLPLEGLERPEKAKPSALVSLMRLGGCKDARFSIHALHGITRLHQRQTWQHRYSGVACEEETEQIRENAKIVTFPMAQVGEGIADVELLEWFVEEGAEVQEFDRLCQVQSDKASLEVTSRYSGRIIKLHHRPGEICKVGEGLVDIEVEHTTGREAAMHQPAATAQPSRSRAAAAEKAAGASVVRASPAVRGLARREGVDLEKVAGTGIDGRITKQDVEAVARRSAAAELAGAESKQDAAGQQRGGEQAAQVQVIPIRGYRRAMVKSMTEALSVPHFHLCDEARIDELLRIRAALRADPHFEQGGKKLTLLPFAVKALSEALKQHPGINAQLDAQHDRLLVMPHHHVGIAMATPAGLVVPVVKHVERRSIPGIAAEVLRLSELARNGRLHSEDLEGGTISVSNIGSIGGTYATPLVQPPQSCILALGRVTTVPRFASDGVTVEQAAILNASWGADHRVVDGAGLAHFNATWKRFMQQPEQLMLMLH